MAVQVAEEDSMSDREAELPPRLQRHGLEPRRRARVFTRRWSPGGGRRPSLAILTSAGWASGLAA